MSTSDQKERDTPHPTSESSSPHLPLDGTGGLQGGDSFTREEPLTDTLGEVTETLQAIHDQVAEFIGDTDAATPEEEELAGQVHQMATRLTRQLRDLCPGEDSSGTETAGPPEV